MNSRPFGTIGWGVAVFLAITVIFAIGTMALTARTAGQISASADPRSDRATAIAGALGAVNPSATSLGRYASSGQPQDLKSFLSVTTLLQQRIQDLSRFYEPGRPEREIISNADAQVGRALSLARQLTAQPGSALLAAGSANGLDAVGADVLSSTGRTLETLLQSSLDRSPVAADGPRYFVWFSAWGAAFAVLGLMLLLTGLRGTDVQPELQTYRPAPATPLAVETRRKSDAPRATFASVATQLEAARLDAPTGLLNRRALSPLVTKSIENSLQKGLTIGVIYVEIDHYKEIRKTRGDAVADALLAETGKLLRETFRRNDHVARLRDAEFAIVVGEISGREILTRLEERIREAVEEVRASHAQAVHLKLSIGLAMYPIDGYSEEDLLAAAREAVIYRNGSPAPEAKPALPAPKSSMPVVEATMSPEPEVAHHDSIEAQAEKSLQELHALIGSYLTAAKGSAEQQAHAQILIGEFKKRA